MASEPTVEPTAASTDNSVDAQNVAPEEHVESAPAPAKKTARKRATKATSRTRKKAEPAESGGAASEEAAEAVAAESDVDSAPAPAKRARRTRKKAEPVVDEPAAEGSGTDEPVADDAVDVPAEEDADSATSDATGAGDETETETETDETEAETDESESDDETSSAVVPSFGLLFQAPEPAPRRRRATSAAGAPAPRADQAADSGDTSGDDAARDTSSGDPTASDSQDSSENTSRDGDSSEETSGGSRRSRRRGGRGRRARGGESDATGDGSDGPAGKDPESRSATAAGDGSPQDSGDAKGDSPASDDKDADEEGGSSRRRRRRRRGQSDDSDESRGARARDEVTALKGSTRLEAKKQRRREGREQGRRRQIITEAEFLARRESVERVMVVRERESQGKSSRGTSSQGTQTQIGVLEDGVLVEHYVSRDTNASMIGNVYVGRVQNVLPSMEAAFVDIGKGRNAVLYAGEVNWDAAGLEGNIPKRIENALSSGDTVLVQVTKDPIGHKGARLTSQISLPGRFLVYVPEANMTGISRKLPDTERSRLKSILKKIVPDDAGVIVRTAAEGASEEELTADIERLTKAWDRIKAKSEKAGKKKGGAPALLHGEPDLTVKVIRDVFNEDFTSLVVAGDKAHEEVCEYLEDVAPELAKRLTKWTGEKDLFTEYRVDEQLAKALDRKVWLPSGGSLVIDRTEAMTVVDVNTGKFVGSGGNLEETVTKNNIEAAEEIVRQLRLRDIGGIIVVDFIDMVLESNRDLVVRRLLECLGRDRTKHQVAEVTSLGLVQMTRKRVGSGLLEVFSESCTHCNGRGIIVHSDPIESTPDDDGGNGRGRGRGRGNGGTTSGGGGTNRGRNSSPGNDQGGADKPGNGGPTAAQIAAAAHAAALKAVAAATTGDDADGDAAEPAPAGSAVEAIAREAAAEAVAEVSPDEVTAEEMATTEAVAEGTTADREAAEGTDAPHTDQSDAAEEPAEPVARPRRKRGRVVAQAGPPGQAEVTVLPSTD